MSLESEKQLSLEELKQHNRPVSSPLTPALPEAEQASPPEPHPTAEEWDELLNMLSALYRLTAEQYDLLGRLLSRPIIYATKEQMAALIKEAAEIRRLLEQAGKQKEKSFSLPSIRLPRPHLPHLDGPTWVVLLMSLAALLLLWWAWAGDWNNLSLPSL